MPGQLTNAEKSARAQELIAFGRVLERRFMERFIGKNETVLIEAEDRGGFMCGYTDSYVRVLTKHGAPNEFVNTIPDSIKEEKNGELSLLSNS